MKKLHFAFSDDSGDVYSDEKNIYEFLMFFHESVNSNSNISFVFKLDVFQNSCYFCHNTFTRDQIVEQTAILVINILLISFSFYKQLSIHTLIPCFCLSS